MKQRFYDPSAIGSDIPRSRKQFFARKLGSIFVSLFGLNRASLFSTEVVQQISPICCIPTRSGELKCKCDHGRLRWRALTFYTEEPETIKWLDSFQERDVFWDIGANVGLYSIYAAKVAKARVLAVEPDSQNYAILMENIVLNQVQDLVEASNMPIAGELGMGRLHVHAMTKGGAYNTFAFISGSSPILSRSKTEGPITQLQIGVSLDDLVEKFSFDIPTHVKIDVDGTEPEIIQGASGVLASEQCRSLLVELQRNLPEHLAVVDKLEKLGFRCISKRSNWDSRENRAREQEHPAVNMIFKKV